MLSLVACPIVFSQAALRSWMFNISPAPAALAVADPLHCEVFSGDYPNVMTLRMTLPSRSAEKASLMAII